MTNREAMIYVILKAADLGRITQLQATNALISIEAGTFIPKNHPEAVLALQKMAAHLSGTAGPVSQFNEIRLQSGAV